MFYDKKIIFKRALREQLFTKISEELSRSPHPVGTYVYIYVPTCYKSVNSIRLMDWQNSLRPTYKRRENAG